MDFAKTWLQYNRIIDKNIKKIYQGKLRSLVCCGVDDNDEIALSAIEELEFALNEILGIELSMDNSEMGNGKLFVNIGKLQPTLSNEIMEHEVQSLGNEGFIIKEVTYKEEKTLVIVSNSSIGFLYAVHYFISLLQREINIENIDIIQVPKNKIRMINQWDNFDGSIERGYAGNSIFNFNDEELNEIRVKDYARMLSSVGINAICINNVNATTDYLEESNLVKVKKINSIFKLYGIKLFMSINFASPILMSNLETSDPLDPQVINWWQRCFMKIYTIIPEFGGVVVKANSEGQPGPADYNRTHAEGANMLARALVKYGGIVFWRAFVYPWHRDISVRNSMKNSPCFSSDVFVELDGQFDENVVVQVKNGPIDFQVKEPVHPLLGQLKHTNVILELQITQEYTGQSTHLCCLLKQWKEILDTDTYQRGEGTTVKSICQGRFSNSKLNGIAAISNIGDDHNWTGHPLALVNLYGFGKIAWDPDIHIEHIVEEWTRKTFGNDLNVIEILKDIIMSSYDVYRSYTYPYGLIFLCDVDEHFRPQPEIRFPQHQADKDGIGKDRTTANGNGYTSYYPDELRNQYENIALCPEDLMLFFHHLPYEHIMKNGISLIQNLYNSYFDGVESVQEIIKKWNKLEQNIDGNVFHEIEGKFLEQLEEAKLWCDTMTLYLYDISGINDIENRLNERGII